MSHCRYAEELAIKGLFVFFFFFKKKTAYEGRISDWSSDVCSSDLWFVNPDHGPLVVAQEQGFFAAQGLEVEMIAPADPNDPPKLVAAGEADLAVSYQPQLHLLAAAGLPLARIGTLQIGRASCRERVCKYV